MSIKIVSDGTAMNTYVYNDDGTKIEGITRLELKPIVGGSILEAVLTFECVELDIKAELNENFSG